MTGSSIKPQDVVIALKLLLMIGRRPWSFPILARELHMSVGNVFSSIQRCRSAGLVRLSNDEWSVARVTLSNFVTKSVPGVFFAEKGQITRGMPTSLHAVSLKELAAKFVGEDLVPLVWPDPEGTVRGETLQPLYKSVPKAAKVDAELYELLALVDVVRVGRAREKKAAIDILEKKIAGKEREEAP